MRARGLAYVRFGLDHPVQYRLLLMRPAVSEHSTAEALAAEACYREQVDAVRVCVDAGVLHGDPAVVAFTLWATVHGCVSMLIARPPFPQPQDIDDFIDATIRSAGLGSALTTRLPPGTALGAASLTRGLDRLAQDLIGDAQGQRSATVEPGGTKGGPDHDPPPGSAGV
ncbi:MAG: TetR-like C-terminal domain-containing protein [Mycobacteriales bacterium]